MPYPANFIQELKARNPIDQVISRHVELKRAGSNLVGRCPFHSERSPSFTVFEDHFHCFGCSAGGDVITFVMRMENLEYRDAIQSLADRCGLTVPDDGYTKNATKAVLTRERAFLMNKLTARHFHANLKDYDAAEARAYLESRQLSRATITRFGIGYAKNSFNDLINYLKDEGFTIDEIKENFLCGISSKSGRPFDMFRNRIIIPIIDTTGNVIAFGGRVLDDSKPKYLNSSDTVVFKKSKNLFALNYAKTAILGDALPEGSYTKPGEMIVCEGYMDVIAMHQAGFGGAVATLGTAITSEHARLISRYAKTVYLAYDSDSAGQNATQKAIQKLHEVGVDAKVLKITGAKDPDEYIKKYGAASFAKILGASEGQTDYRLNRILEKYDITLPEQKEKAVHEACMMISEIDSPVSRDIYATRLAQITEINKIAVEDQIKRYTRSANRKIRKSFNDDIQKKLLRYDDKINIEAAAKMKETTLEQRILGIVMLYPEFLETVEELNSDVFVTQFNKTLFERLKLIYSTGEFELSALNEFYNPQEISYILEIRNSRNGFASNGKDTLLEQINALNRIKNSKPSNGEDPFEVLKRIKEQKKKGN